MKGIGTLMLIGVILVIATAGALALHMGGVISLPFSVTSAELGSCRLAETEFITIKCLPSGNAVPSVYSASTSGTSIKIDTVDTVIQSNKFTEIVGGAVIQGKIYDSSGSLFCSFTKGGITGTYNSNCIGRTLVTGQTYSFKHDCNLLGCGPNTAQITLTGRMLFLHLSAPQIGIDEVKLPGTANCIMQDISTQASATGLADNIDNTAPQSVTMTQGESQTYARGYKERPPITTVNINGQAGFCDQINKKVIGFQKKTSIDGTCWALQDPALVLKDGTNSKFCCSSSVCQTLYGLGTDYACTNFECIKGGPDTTACFTNSDCSGTIATDFVKTADGRVILQEPSCVSGQCVTKSTEVACSPEDVYPNNQCCKRIPFTSTYKLEACTSPLTSCDTLGADACCLDTQSQYTFKAPPAGKFCCDKDNNGVGYVTESKNICEGNEPGGFGGLLDGLFNGIGDLFGGLFDGLNDIWDGLLLLLTLIAIILVLIIGYKIVTAFL